MNNTKGKRYSETWIWIYNVVTLQYKRSDKVDNESINLRPVKEKVYFMKLLNDLRK